MGKIKGQFWSFDMIFAVIIFSFAITILAFTWYNITNQLSLGYSGGSDIMQLQLQTFSQNLFAQGTPSNWQGAINAANTSTWSGISIGLASPQGGYALSPNKVYALISMANYNYQASKQVLGLGYDYYITIKSSAKSGSPINISIGSNPASNGALTVYVANKNALMNGVPVSVRILVWTNTTSATS